MSVNKFIGIGNLTKDPEVRYMVNGEAVANCSIACNEKWKNKAGEKQESVEYINLVFYSRLAEIAGEYLKKGAQIYVEGKLHTRKWQDKDGQDRYTTEIKGERMQMLGGREQGGKQTDSRADSSVSNPAATQNQQKVGSGFDDFDEDLPF